MDEHDDVEQLRRRHHEYYNPDASVERRGDLRLREIIERIKDEDNRQNHRIQALEDAVDVLKADVAGIWKSYTRLETALIGHNGQNGIRGTMQEHYRTTTERLDKMETSIDAMSAELRTLITTMTTILKVAGSLAGLATFVGVIIGIVRAVG